MCLFFWRRKKKKQEAKKVAEVKPEVKDTMPLDETKKVEEKPVEKTEVKPVEPKVAEVKKAPAKKAPAKKPAATQTKKAEPKKAPAKKVAAKTGEEVAETVEKPKVDYRVYHVSKREEDGMWQVKYRNGEKAIKLFKTKKEAMEYTKEMAEHQHGKVVVHASKGEHKGQMRKR